MDQAEQLRNAVKTMNRNKNKSCARVITVTSGKGGEKINDWSCNSYNIR